MEKKFNTYQSIGLIVQVVLLVFMTASVIYSLFEPALNIIVNILMSLFFVSLAINNHITFKRKNFTIIYLIVAILIVVVALI